MNNLAIFGLLIAIAAVAGAYHFGFAAGFAAGRDEGYGDGKREGSREGSMRGYAVGFDRGRRKNEDGDSDGASRSGYGLGLIGLVLAGMIAAVLMSQTDEQPPGYSNSPSLERIEPSLSPAESSRMRPSDYDLLDEPSID